MLSYEEETKNVLCLTTGVILIILIETIKRLLKKTKKNFTHEADSSQNRNKTRGEKKEQNDS